MSIRASLTTTIATRSSSSAMSIIDKEKKLHIYTSITPREQEILHLIAYEHSTKEVAAKLFISAETVYTHRKNIMSKLGVKNTAGMIRVAMQHCLLRLTMMVIFCVLGHLSYANVHTVSSVADDNGTNTLRSIIGSSTTMSGDTVIFASSINGMPIILTSQIASSKSLVIVGNDPHNTIIDGGSGTHRLFDLNGAWVFKNMTFRNGGSNQVFGGAIKSNSNLSLTQCIFYSNVAHTGGAIFVDGIAKIYNSLFYKNMTIENQLLISQNASTGGAIHHNTGNMDIINCTISNNISANGGGGISAEVLLSSVTNSIVTFNKSDNNQDNDMLVLDGNNNIFASLIGQFNGIGLYINDDPMFMDTAINNYRLKVFSPGINVGFNGVILTSQPDLDGNPRIRQGTVDIGAYEGINCNVPDTLYVNHSSSNPDDGSSWSSALTDLQEAINISNACGGGKQIWVANGTYRPTQAFDLDENETIENREKTFYITQPVQIYGGFTAGQTMLTQRDRTNRNTILTADLGNNQDTAFHVMFMVGNSITSDWIIDGLKIQYGRAEGLSQNDEGGGIYASAETTNSVNITNCSFNFNKADYGAGVHLRGENITSKITDCIFNGNFAEEDGGGIVIAADSTNSPTIFKCIFIFNKTNNEEGGGIYSSGAKSNIPSIKFCTFRANQSNGPGGGIYARSSILNSPNIQSCSFYENQADEGSGIYSDSFEGMNSPSITNCTFAKNNSKHKGGGIFTIGDINNPIMTNCTFYDNSAIDKGGEFGAQGESSNIPNITNCILWNTIDNGSGVIWMNRSDAGAKISHSIVTGGGLLIDLSMSIIDTSDSFLHVDPMLEILNSTEPHLHSTSPAINAGLNSNIPTGITFDFFGFARIQNGIVDIGAIEFERCPDVPLSFSPPDNFGASALEITTSQTITADNMILGSQQVKYLGGQGTILNNNFEVASGALLEVDIGDCASN